jgi:4-diphosphocytidyl-2-C-methyl-D-erythritol kinase
MTSPLRAIAFAKVNLFLEITGKRADGYHTLSTVFQTISLGDELTAKVSESLSLTCSETSLPTDQRNLAMRAAVQLKGLLNEPRGAALGLKKVVPMGAGLGGGSSDAAAVLTALPRLWNRRAPASDLSRMASQLGADVPFFLEGGTCAAEGIGEILRPLPKLPKTWLVLVFPGFGVATKDAYAKVRLPLANPRSASKIIPLLKKGRPAHWAGELFNRFEELVFPDHPELPKLKQALVEAGAVGALMSGSGSSVFGVVESPSSGRKVLAVIRKRYPQSWLVHTI